ncbi:MAG: NAD(+) synthase [Acutalibacteraceae bacterium]
MKNLIRAAAFAPRVTVGGVESNRAQLAAQLREAAEQGCDLAVFPELCLTGSTAGDRFYNRYRLRPGADRCGADDAGIAAGLPAAVAVTARRFAGRQAARTGAEAPFVGARTDIFSLDAPRNCCPTAASACSATSLTSAALHVGAGLATTGTAAPERSRPPVRPQSTSWSGAPNGGASCWRPARPTDSAPSSAPTRARANRRPTMYSAAIASSVKTGTSAAKRRRFRAKACFMTSIPGSCCANASCGRGYGAYPRGRVPLDARRSEKTSLLRDCTPLPFVPADAAERARRCRAILDMQAAGLRQRLLHTRAKRCVIGISGGLDSTLALLVTAQTYASLGMPASDILCVTMPGFGTTARTKSNALLLCETLGVSLREVPIADAVRVHFRDIGHDEDKRDVTYENAQARERTQVLMDIANACGGLVIGTGDLSELALGWATYNGDHMSMYGVNASVPKTLVRHLVAHCAAEGSPALRSVLEDILATPVSPELLPPENGDISQKTEELVGPYELHDFFLYHFLRCGYPPAKLLAAAMQAFAGVYTRETLLRWMETFFRRFFAQQFKRSCLPDGPKVGSVGVSPRGDLCLPSDASAEVWLREIEALKAQ